MPVARRLVSRGPLAGLPRRAVVDRAAFITPRQQLTLVNGEAFAEHQGWGFAAHVTLHWQCDPAFRVEAWASRTKTFLDKLVRWLQRQNIPVAYAWAHEVGREYGAHTHVLLHLPRAKRAVREHYQTLIAKLAAWVIETENLATDKVDRHGKPWLPVKITPDEPHTYGARNRKMRSGLLKYLLEGIDPDDVAYTGAGPKPRAETLGVRPKRNAGQIPHKRCGTSHSLGPMARKAAGWSELTAIQDLHERLNPG